MAVMQSSGRWLGWAALLAAVAGCGTGAYRERMNKQIEKLGRGVPGQDMLTDASDFPGTPLEFRLPLQFQTPLSPTAGQEKAQRRMPPVTVPGLLGTWEAHAEQGGVKQPFYFYLGLVDKAKDTQDPSVVVQREIQGQWPGVGGKWVDFNDLAGRPWKRFRVDLADLDWVPLDGAGKEAPPQKAGGVVEFDCRDEGSHWIVAGWRVPRSIESQARLDGVIGPTLSSLKIKK